MQSHCQQTQNTASSEELHRELCAGADEEDEVDHDMRRDEEHPRLAAAAEVPRVEAPAVVALELTPRQRQDIRRHPPG